MSYLEHFQHRAVDGIVVICSDQMDKHVQELIQSSIPIVVVDMDSTDCSVVFSDNLSGGTLAVNHLYELGHRLIAHIAGDMTIDAGLARIEGYKQAMDRLALTIPEGYLINGGFFSVEEGKQAMQTLLALPKRPTAVFVAGDQMAIGAMEAIHEAGLQVPHDISVVGYDDIEMSKYVTPKLTTVRQDTERIGQHAAELLIEQIVNKRRVMTTDIIPVDLIVRQSTGPVKP